MKQKLNAIKELNFWFALKWLGIILVVIYMAIGVGQKVYQDVTGYRVNYSFSVSYESDGLLKPYVEAH